MPAAFAPGEYLGRDVIGRPADRRLAFGVALDAAREAKVADLEPAAGGRAVVERGVGARALDALVRGCAAAILGVLGEVRFGSAGPPRGFVESRGGEEEVTELEIPVNDAVRV